jgi:hypothetical protein
LLSPMQGKRSSAMQRCEAKDEGHIALGKNQPCPLLQRLGERYDSNGSRCAKQAQHTRQRAREGPHQTVILRFH